MDGFEFTIKSDDYVRPPVWIIGPRSYLSDRAVPLLDIIAVPARKFGKEKITFVGQTETSVSREYHARRHKIFHPFQSQKKELGDAGVYYIDLRIFGLGNWSHFLNKAVPVAAAIKEKLIDMGKPDPVFILDEKVFSAISEFMEGIGLNFICTNSAVEAHHIIIEASNFSVIDNLSRELIDPISDMVDRIVENVPDTYGDKIFINRKPPSRSILNIDVIREDLLSSGFIEYFMEDFSAAEQIAIIQRCSSIVAIHGAALAPLMFRNKSHGPLDFVEIVPPGHVVPFFKSMVDDIPCTYRMVRGVPEADLITDAFSNIDKPSMEFTKKHSLKQFNLDLVSLRFALDSLNSKSFPFDAINTPIS